VGRDAFDLTPDRTWSVGRDPSRDIVVDHAFVSRHHGELAWVGAAWVFRDLGSRNGSWIRGHRIPDLVIDGAVEVRLGQEGGPTLRLTPLDRGARLASEPSRAAPSVIAEGRPVQDPSRVGEPAGLHRVGEAGLRIGRSPDNDLVLADLLVSRHHARISRETDGRLRLVDLDSSNGTFVNGRRVRERWLTEGDLVGIGGHVFVLQGSWLQEYEEAGGAWLCALHLGVRVSSGQRLLAGVSFALEPSSLLGLVGPSGAGKTTLLRALSGQQPAQEGQVLYGGRDLYRALDLRRRMGYVPQDDLLHPQLTVRQALDYAAELRFARDVEPDARASRVDDVLRELALEERQHLVISRLSGGQRKRTSVASELLARPPLLFLDEPTSGLDPGNEEQVTALLRELADSGRTVVVATHSLVTLERCDRVLFLAKGGHEAFFGPPELATRYFAEHGHGTTYPRVFAALDEANGEALGAAFARDAARRTYVEEPLALARGSDVGERPAGPDARSDRLRQWWVLVRRYLAVLRADRVSTLILLAQAPFFAVLFALLYPYNVLSTANASEATILMWLLVVGAAWIGTSNSVREVVKERPILLREHGLGLSLGAYVSSKLAVLTVITAVQCAILAVATLIPQRLPPVDPIGGVVFAQAGVLFGSRLPELTLDIVVAGVASMALGLLLSALVRNADQANFVLPLVLVAQVVLSAPVLGSPGPVFAALGTVSTAQWGTAAAGATISLNDVRRPYLEVVENQRAAAERRAPDPSVAQGRSTWDHTLGAWLLDMGALVVLGVASILGLYAVLSRQLRVPSAPK
jgi:ABC-type multidrug transport system ATPase subunit/pSer/pThr/pTyr-binding forkhead associated (FHA) protein